MPPDCKITNTHAATIVQDKTGGVVLIQHPK